MRRRATTSPTLATNPQYTSIASERQFRRLAGYVDDAREQGASIHPLHEEASDVERRRLSPVALTDVNDAMRVMQEEIFGPILPVVGYDTIDEAIAFVNARPRPLALYYFGARDRNLEAVLERTLSGGVTVNNTALHVVQENLPFGGVGPERHGRVPRSRRIRPVLQAEAGVHRRQVERRVAARAALRAKVPRDPRPAETLNQPSSAPRVVAQVVFHEGRDEVVAVVVARLASQRQRVAGVLAGLFEPFRQQLLLQELVRIPLVDEQRRAARRPLAARGSIRRHRTAASARGRLPGIP